MLCKVSIKGYEQIFFLCEYPIIPRKGDLIEWPTELNQEYLLVLEVKLNRTGTTQPYAAQIFCMSTEEPKQGEAIVNHYLEECRDLIEDGLSVEDAIDRVVDGHMLFGDEAERLLELLNDGEQE